jgi:hypothetical protein
MDKLSALPPMNHQQNVRVPHPSRLAVDPTRSLRRVGCHGTHPGVGRPKNIFTLSPIELTSTAIYIHRQKQRTPRCEPIGEQPAPMLILLRSLTTESRERSHLGGGPQPYRRDVLLGRKAQAMSRHPVGPALYPAGWYLRGLGLGNWRYLSALTALLAALFWAQNQPQNASSKT